VRWLLAAAAAGVLIGLQIARQSRARALRRAERHDLNRWEGEGGQLRD
jgi:hypothetical protein